MTEKDRISEYKKTLQTQSFKSITDLNESMDIDFNFQLLQIKELVNAFNGIMPPNRISHYILAFIKNGKGTKTIGRFTFSIEPGMLLIFPKKIIHSTNRWSLDTTGYMLSFNEAFFEEGLFPINYLPLPQLFKRSILPYKLLDPTQAKNIENTFNEINDMQTENDIRHSKLFILKVAELILKCHNIFSRDNEENDKSNLLFDQFVELLENHFRKHHDVAFYANKLSIHPNYLNKMAQQFASVSVKEYIQQRICSEAKYLLSATKIPVKEIAYDIGFTDNNYFSRYFKQITGISPQDYRNKNS